MYVPYILLFSSQYFQSSFPDYLLRNTVMQAVTFVVHLCMLGNVRLRMEGEMEAYCRRVDGE